MSHFIALIIVTLLIIFLGKKIWDLTRNIALIVGFGLIYYWTLLGSWFIVFDNITDRAGEKLGLHYYYLFDRLFRIYNDQYYLKAICYYGIFIVGLQLTLLFFLKKYKKTEIETLPENRIHLSNVRLIGLSIFAVFASFYFMRKQILYAIATEQSVYTITRTYTDRFTSLHQIFNVVAVIPLYVGFLTLIGREKVRLFYESYSRKKQIAYVIAIIGVEAYLTFLGNKHEIFFGAILGILFFIKNTVGEIQWKKIAIFFLITGIPLFFNDVLRGFSPQVIVKIFYDKVEPMETQGMTKHEPTPEISVSSTASSMLFSNEMFSGHFSMYGVLKHDVKPTYGSSFKYLGTAVVPRIILPDRPDDIYAYYASSVNAYKGQGFTINHATGWYLNFGFIGLLVGSVVLGLFWGFIIKKGEEYNQTSKLFLRVLWFVAALAFVAKIPVIVRGGPEAFKPLILEGLLIPALLIFICVDRKKTGSTTK